jgi:hypothetical protein
MDPKPDPDPLARGMDPRIRILQNVIDPQHWRGCRCRGDIPASPLSKTSRTAVPSPELLPGNPLFKYVEEKFPHLSSVVDLWSDYIFMMIRNHNRIRFYMLISIRILLQNSASLIPETDKFQVHRIGLQQYT